MTTHEQNIKATLGRLDRLASEILTNGSNLGLSPEGSFALAQQVDRVADQLEAATWGPEVLQQRAVGVMASRLATEPGGLAVQAPAATPATPAAPVTAAVRTAEVIQRDADEAYMNAFKNPMAPIQVESDEPYMAAYKDDQSSAVIHGESTSGRALAPGH